MAFAERHRRDQQDCMHSNFTQNLIFKKKTFKGTHCVDLEPHFIESLEKSEKLRDRKFKSKHTSGTVQRTDGQMLLIRAKTLATARE